MTLAGWGRAFILLCYTSSLWREIQGLASQILVQGRDGGSKGLWPTPWYLFVSGGEVIKMTSGSIFYRHLIPPWPSLSQALFRESPLSPSGWTAPPTVHSPWPSYGFPWPEGPGQLSDPCPTSYLPCFFLWSYTDCGGLWRMDRMEYEGVLILFPGHWLQSLLTLLRGLLPYAFA